MKKILILGASGFIGSNLVEFFNKQGQYEVVCQYFENDKFITKNNQWIYADLRSKIEVERLFALVKPNIVLQYAAYTTNSKDVIQTPFNHSTTNYIINALVLEASHKTGVEHFIYPSCATMYASKETLNLETDWTLDTIPHCYKHVAYMKTAVERMCEAYSSMGKCKYTVIRQSNIYGPNDKTDLNQAHFLPAMISKIAAANDVLEIWGDGKAKRDVLYVEDLINMVDKVLQNQQASYEIFNCGLGKAYSILEIVQAIQNGFKKNNLQLIYNTSKPNIPTITILNIEKAKNMLGWEPQTSIEDGLEKTIAWYQKTFTVERI